MPCDVSGQISSGAIPPTVALRFGLESGTLTKERQHAIWLEFQQIFRVRFLSRFERPSRQPHMAQRQRVQLDSLAALQPSGVLILSQCAHLD